MKSVKRTYTLPLDILNRFEKAVSPDKRSSIVAELIAAWLPEKEREQLRLEVIAGCLEMTEICLQTEREFHPLEEEWHRRKEFEA